MKKRKMMVIVTAIALGIACLSHFITQTLNDSPGREEQFTLPYVPPAFIDVMLFPGNLYEFLINHL